jgi:hypothetical protein
LANEIRFDSTIGNNYNYLFNFSIPATLPAGSYTFQLRLFDGVGNNVFSRDLIVNLN